MSGALQLIGVKCRCKVGVPKEERAKRQKILLDLTVSVDLQKAALSDDIADSPDYDRLEQAVRAAVESKEFRLLERLADAALDAALAFDPRIHGAAIAARKFPAAMPGTKEVVVRLSKSQTT
ncbi:MAG: dihydroneopterin aldolase [Elusimicrobia bacterium]|nr:dihydroneopterin aldolase [Elusimicrobiota bacterium]